MLNLSMLIAQIGIILGVARLIGLAFRKIHQPQVISEMVAGVLLGPSFLGWIAPDLMRLIFPPQSLDFLNALGQIGILVYVFLIGVKMDFKEFRSNERKVLLISHTTILLPFCLGGLLALFLYPRLSSTSVPFTGFVLFMGAAVSITALPVLARILTERGLLHSRVGMIAIASAAAGDLIAWCLLALLIVQASTFEGRAPVWSGLLCVSAYLALMLGGIRQLLRRLEAAYIKRGDFSQNMMALAVLLMLASAWAANWAGIHHLFGAFLAGMIMPKGEDFSRSLAEKFESMTVILLLPLFFTSTGLRTSIQLVSGAGLWFYSLLIIAVSCIGKFGGSMMIARLLGMSWREAGALGALMNTRGLMELVILNIGLERSIITPTLYSMLVLMALLTTFITSPLLQWIYPAQVSIANLTHTTEPERAPAWHYSK
jgi:Kef-type K+ transport system membrane component KefB